MNIYSNNTDAVADMLEGAQKRARVRTLDADDIKIAAEAAEAELANRDIPIKARTGCTIEVEDGERVANGYRGNTEHTVAYLTRNTVGWLLTDVARERCGSISGGGHVDGVTLFLSPAAIEAVTAAAKRPIHFG